LFKNHECLSAHSYLPSIDPDATRGSRMFHHVSCLTLSIGHFRYHKSNTAKFL